MNNQKALRIVNACLAADFLVLAGFGVFNDLIPWDLFHIVHPLFGFFSIGLVALHLFLNRKWIRQSYFKKKGKGPAA